MQWWCWISDTVVSGCEALLFTVRAEEDFGQGAVQDVEGMGAGLSVEADVRVVGFFVMERDAAVVVVPAAARERWAFMSSLREQRLCLVA